MLAGETRIRINSKLKDLNGNANANAIHKIIINQTHNHDSLATFLKSNYKFKRRNLRLGLSKGRFPAEIRAKYLIESQQRQKEQKEEAEAGETGEDKGSDRERERRGGGVVELFNKFSIILINYKILLISIVNIFRKNSKYFGCSSASGSEINESKLQRQTTAATSMMMMNAILSTLMTLFIALVGLQRVEAGACWQAALSANGKCSEIYSLNITKEECCRVSQEFSYTERELTSVEYFFATAIGGGAECAPCVANCKNVKCEPNKICVKRRGRPKCICAPECDATAQRKQQRLQKQRRRAAMAMPTAQIMNPVKTEEENNEFLSDKLSLSSEFSNIKLDFKHELADQNRHRQHYPHEHQHHNHHHHHHDHQNEHRQRAHHEHNEQHKNINQRTGNEHSECNNKHDSRSPVGDLLLVADADAAGAGGAAATLYENMQQTARPTTGAGTGTRRLQIFSNVEFGRFGRRRIVEGMKSPGSTIARRRNHAQRLQRQRQRERSHSRELQQQTRHTSGKKRSETNKDNGDDVANNPMPKTRHIHLNEQERRQQKWPTSSGARLHTTVGMRGKQQRRKQHQHKDRHANRTWPIDTPSNTTTGVHGSKEIAASSTTLTSPTTSLATTTMARKSSTSASNKNEHHERNYFDRPRNAIDVGLLVPALAPATATATAPDPASVPGTRHFVNSNDFALFEQKNQQPMLHSSQHWAPMHSSEDHPVCGTDGRTYRTGCQLKKRACRMNSQSLQVAYHGHCRTSCNGVKCLHGLTCVEDQYMLPHCIPCNTAMMCPYNDGDHDLDGDGQPDDDNDNGNENANANANVGKDVNANDDDFVGDGDGYGYGKNYVIDPKRAVCGVDGKTYKSTCAINRMICKIGRAIAIAYPGPCRADRLTCADLNCGSRNKCLVDLLTHEPRCVSCRHKCSRKQHQVRTEDGKICGVNNRTYNSWCEMRKDSCATGFNIELKYAHACR